MSAATRTTDTSPPPALHYRLPATNGGLWLGLRPGALLALGLTITVAVTSSMAGLPLPLALLVLSGGTLLAALPVAGRTPLAWTPVLLTHLHGGATGRTGWSRPLTEQPPPPSPAAGRSARPVVRLALPAEWGRTQLLALPIGESHEESTSLAVLQHRDTHTITVVLDVIGTDRFALLDPAGQDNHLARWGSCLSALAADPDVVRLQWLTHARPDTHDHTIAMPTAAVADPRLWQDYAGLAVTAARAALTHQHLLAITLSAERGMGSSRPRPRPRPRRRAATLDKASDDALIEHIRDLAATLLSADLLPHPLTPAELGSTLRRLTDPTVPDTSEPAQDPRRWAISSRRSSWDSCRTDDSWHRSFAVTGWPRLALPADWLAPILHTAPPEGTSRTLAVHAVPVAPQHAVRRARAARAKAQLDATERTRLGFTPHPGDALAETDAAETEAELLAGYRLTQLSALVTVSAHDPQRLQAATTALGTLSASHRLDLRPLHGQHARGLVGCLPLGLPLPGARS
jgi:hypothetical protein